MYQEFKNLGEKEFEKIYKKSDPKSLEKVCYAKYYSEKEKKFTLIKDQKKGGIKEIGYFLEVFLDNGKKITKIQAKSPFYWKEWNLEEDIERDDWSVKVKKDKVKNRIIDNFISDSSKKSADRPFVSYSFILDLQRVVFGDITTNYNLLYTLSGVTVYFKNQVNFSFAVFEGEVSFFNVMFESTVDFFVTTFKGNTFFSRMIFEHETNFSFSSFKNNASFSAIFKKEAEFSHATFKENVFFDNSVFKDRINFCRAQFQNEAYFRNVILWPNDAKKYIIDLFSINAKKDFRLEADIKRGKSLLINLNCAMFENRLFFNLKNDDLYQILTLNLKDISCADFICEDRNLYQTKLWHTENKEARIDAIKNKAKLRNKGDFQKKQENKHQSEIYELKINTIKTTDVIEQAVQERRVFRKILQDLHWGEYADEEYAKIMDLQSELDFREKGNAFGNFWRKWIYQKAFGWGVRMQNLIWTSVIFITIFTFIYLLCDWLGFSTGYFNNANLKSIKGDNGIWFLSHLRFAIWNSFLLADLSRDYGWFITLISTVQGILGIIYVTVLVAIISRKFMRM